MEHEHAKYLRWYRALLRENGINEAERQAMLQSYGYTSSKQFKLHELIEICQNLQIDPKLDKARKRVLKATDVLLTTKGYKTNPALVKAVAVRAAKMKPDKGFNDIPYSKLNAIYNSFKDEMEIREFNEKNPVIDLNMVDRLN